MGASRREKRLELGAAGYCLSSRCVCGSWFSFHGPLLTGRVGRQPVIAVPDRLNPTEHAELRHACFDGLRGWRPSSPQHLALDVNDHPLVLRALAHDPQDSVRSPGATCRQGRCIELDAVRIERPPIRSPSASPFNARTPAMICRMASALRSYKGCFRFRADRTGVEIQGTLIEPHEGAETGAREVEAGSTPQSGADDERHSGDAQP